MASKLHRKLCAATRRRSRSVIAYKSEKARAAQFEQQMNGSDNEGAAQFVNTLDSSFVDFSISFSQT